MAGLIVVTDTNRHILARKDILAVMVDLDIYRGGIDTIATATTIFEADTGITSAGVMDDSKEVMDTSETDINTLVDSEEAVIETVVTIDN